MLSISIKI